MVLGFYRFFVSEDHEGKSVKTFLRKTCGLTARTMTLLKYSDMGITRNGIELRAHDILHQGDELSLTLPEDQNDIVAVKGDLDILYEDDHLLIVNKPPNMPVHPTKIHQEDTLANIVAYYQQSRGENYAFRAVNRLDKDTSGCVIIAKDRIAYSLVKPTVKKTYIAVCEGLISDAGTVDAPIALSPGSKIRRCVHGDGAEAITHYHPISRSSSHTMLELWLETGRTHQIRCHMSWLGYPLAGDDLYGGGTELINRQALHCKTVSFQHPVSREMILIDTEIPEDIQKISVP